MYCPTFRASPHTVFECQLHRKISNKFLTNKVITKYFITKHKKSRVIEWMRLTLCDTTSPPNLSQTRHHKVIACYRADVGMTSKKLNKIKNTFFILS